MGGGFSGILLMTLAMAGFALEDMFIKLAAAGLPTGQVVLAIGIFGTTFFAILSRIRGGPSLLAPGFGHPAVLARNLGEIVGSMSFIIAITVAEITTATAVFQALPLAVTLGAALFLGESVGWRRWTAIGVGFAGVLLIIRPGVAGFDPMALWSVAAVIFLTLRDLATRRAPPHVTSLQLSGWAMAVMGAAGGVLLIIEGGPIMPTMRDSLFVGGAMVASVLAYWALTEATRWTAAGVTTSFRYSRLVFALIIGFVVFGERPDAWIWAGSALIVASGLYTLARERRLRRLSSPARPS